MQSRVLALALASLILGCASSDDSIDTPPTGDTGAKDTFGTDTSEPDTTVTPDTGGGTDSSTSADTGDDTGDDTDFPDFGGTSSDGGADGLDLDGGGSTDGGGGTDGGSAATCKSDAECASPYNCCDVASGKCGIKLGPTCLTI